jgi:hypothetical protein
MLLTWGISTSTYMHERHSLELGVKWSQVQPCQPDHKKWPLLPVYLSSRWHVDASARGISRGACMRLSGSARLAAVHRSTSPGQRRVQSGLVSNFTTMKIITVWAEAETATTRLSGAA